MVLYRHLGHSVAKNFWKQIFKIGLINLEKLEKLEKKIKKSVKRKKKFDKEIFRNGVTFVEIVLKDHFVV